MSSASENQTHKWTADRPLERLEEDLLSRSRFADRIASELHGWQHTKESLVLSLNGNWGAGKTTFKNFIVRCLERQAEENKCAKIPVVEFNPWQWSGQDKLLEAFFDEIGAVFRRGKLGDNVSAERLARYWEGLKVATIAVGEIAMRLQQSLTALAALLAGGSGIVGSYLEIGWKKSAFEWTGIALFAVATACAVYAPFAEKIAEFFKWRSQASRPTLDQIRKQLRQELEKLDTPILVVIDDIDRLTKEEIRLVVQLVKANASFPNVVYLLLFQKEIASAALDEVTCEAGQNFLKKIVQVELEVPAAPDHKMRELLWSGLSRIHDKAITRWDADQNERFRELFDDAIFSFFDTPRDIKRFLGVLEFYFEGHVVKGHLEVNFTDLALLETLRMFDPQAYDGVSRAFQRRRNVLIQMLLYREETQQEFAAGVKLLLDRPDLAEEEKRRLGALLYGMFPQARQNAGEPSADWDRDNRICHPRHFPKYFQLEADPGDVPLATIAELISAGEDRKRCSEIFLRAAAEDTFMRLLERFRSEKDDLPESSIETFVGSLLDVSDELPRIKGKLEFEGDGERELARFAIFLLTRIPDIDSRGQALLRASTTSRAVTGPVMCTSMLETRGEKEPSREELIVNADVVEELKKTLVPRLWAASDSGRFWTLRMVDYFIYRLRDWAGPEVVRKWLAQQILVPGNAATFLRTMLQVTSVSGGGRYHKVFKLPVASLADFADLRSLHDSAAMADLDELLKLTLKVLESAVSDFAAGHKVESRYVASQDASGKLFVDEADATL